MNETTTYQRFSVGDRVWGSFGAGTVVFAASTLIRVDYDSGQRDVSESTNARYLSALVADPVMARLLRRNPDHQPSPTLLVVCAYKRAVYGDAGAERGLVELAMVESREGRLALRLLTALKMARMEAEGGADFWRSLRRLQDEIRN